MSTKSIGVIADLAHSVATGDVERAITKAGLRLQPVRVGEHDGGAIMQSMSNRVMRSLKALDLTDPSIVNRVLRAVADLAEVYTATPSADQRLLVRLHQALDGDGFALTLTGDPLAAIRGLALAASDVLPDASAIRTELTRLESSLDDDPSRAIGTAKRLVESTAKVVLTCHGVNPKKYQGSMMTLVPKAMELLRLNPGQVPEGTPEAQAVRELLVPLRELALKVNTLRNKAGDGHGTASAITGIGARDARLAVRAAIAWCAYILDVLAEQPMGGARAVSPTPTGSSGA